ncbi:unnamed protein product [Durusdinium trenchii]|uniref:Endonuclease/exonuclease/phosphatase domain-containing protein n=1 Tax=Durusdinium trenchii TaxID=1381693 RepID=A0ABP0M2S9_9DINO
MGWLLVWSLQSPSKFGYPTSPAWPGALSCTQAFFEHVTQEVIYGAMGRCVVCGDMNASTAALSVFEANVSTIDHLWLSPEAQALCRAVEVRRRDRAMVQDGQCRLQPPWATVRSYWPVTPPPALALEQDSDLASAFGNGRRCAIRFSVLQ